jgi:hypothetical protein
MALLDGVTIVFVASAFSMRAVSARDVCAILNTHKPRSTRHSLLFFRAADTSFAMLCVDPSSLDGADIM